MTTKREAHHMELQQLQQLEVSGDFVALAARLKDDNRFAGFDPQWDQDALQVDLRGVPITLARRPVTSRHNSPYVWEKNFGDRQSIMLWWQYGKFEMHWHGGPWYDDSNPEGHGATPQEASVSLTESIENIVESCLLKGLDQV